MLEPLPRLAPAAVRRPHAAAPVLEARRLTVAAGRRTLLRAVDLQLAPREVHAVLGPSGAGKSTLLRCLNRLVDLSPGLAVTGDVLLAGRSVYARGTDPDRLRERIGMLFQQPVVFPGSIADNVLFGLRHTGRARRREWPERLERALREAALWDEVADRLAQPAACLSVGQQQRLCLARALAVEPEALLLDEPTSALDPRATAAIEELILALRERHAVLLVTHQAAQARRLADRISYLRLRDGAGELLAGEAARAALDEAEAAGEESA